MKKIRSFDRIMSRIIKDGEGANVEQEVKNTSAHPNRDLIFFLEIVLKACNEILKNEGKIGEQLLNYNLEEYNSTKGHFADRLCALIFDSHKKVIENKVFLTIGNSKQTIEIKTELSNLDFFKMSEEHEKRLRQLSIMLNNSFLENNRKKELQGKIADLLVQRERIENLQTPFPPIEVVEEYLSSYYGLLSYLMINEEIVRISETAASLLGLLIRLDTKNDKASLLSPMAMNAVRKMYLGIEEYCKQISEKKMIDDVLNIFYQSVVIKKAQNSFRWFTFDEDGKIWHYAVTPSCDISQSTGYLMIRGRSINEYNSFEGIGEQRIGEKILYEIEKELNKLGKEEFFDKEIEFNIAVLGDLNKKALKSMKKYVEDVLPFRLSSIGSNVAEVKLNFHAYSKNFKNDEEDNAEERKITYSDDLDDVFSDSEKVSKLIEENQMVFMLDCIKMYQPITVVPSADILNLKQRFVFAEALESATIEKIDLCAPNYLELLYENMSVYNIHGFFGRMRKRANDAFLEFCQKQIKNIANKSDRNHSVYVYVSDLSAFANVYCNDQYFVRTERYNQKEIGIIRYTSDGTEKKYLPGRKEDHDDIINNHPMICFNVWQIIKHICLEKADDIIKIIKEKDDKIYIHDLHRLYIGIDYNEWPKQLNLYYGLKEAPKNEFQEHKDSYMRFLQKFAENVVVPIFNANNKNMFQQYFWRTIYSLLYGDSKDVRDMLFIHLLEEYRDKIGKAVLVKEHRAEHENKVMDYVNVDYRYSIKRFYEKIMREYDISADNSFDQQWTAHIIDKNKTLEESSRNMFEKVVAACEELGYDKSYLYRNCSRVLGIK